MPQENIKTKPKGRHPAHQNAFAFQHNPKSKRTEKILSMPNRGLCQRCHDKIEWRKKYRKYKPLTQPSKCNLCKHRNVKAAYHTICIECASKDGKCAMCVKEPALPEPLDDEAKAEERQKLIASMGKMKLRDKRALERRLARDGNEKDKEEQDEDNDNDSIDDGDGSNNVEEEYIDIVEEESI